MPYKKKSIFVPENKDLEHKPDLGTLLTKLGLTEQDLQTATKRQVKSNSAILKAVLELWLGRQQEAGLTIVVQPIDYREALKDQEAIDLVKESIK